MSKKPAKESHAKLSQLMAEGERNHALSLSNIMKSRVRTWVIDDEQDKIGIYGWEPKMKLWRKMTKSALINKITGLSDKMIRQEIAVVDKKLDNKEIQAEEKKKLLEEKKQLGKTLRQANSYTYNRKVIGFLLDLLIDEEFVAKLDVGEEFLNFRNGVYNLKTKEFRERIPEDNFTKCLKFDWSETRNKKVDKIVMTIIRNVCNDSDELTEFMLQWLGYCTTGNTSLQQFVIIMGHTASNGKSTLLEIFKAVFPIYTLLLSRSYFNKGNQKQHKDNKGITTLTRLAFFNELARKSLDVEDLKDKVSGNSVSNEVLFAYMEEIELYVKYMLTTQHIPKFKNDEGLRRRLIAIEFINKFLEPSEYNKLPKGHIYPNGGRPYIKDKTLLENFKNDDVYKLAFTQLMVKYACRFYEKGMTIDTPDFVDNLTSEVCDQNDAMNNFLSEHYEVIGPSTNVTTEDVIHKSVLLNDYRVFSKQMNFSEGTLISEMKKYQIHYNRGLQRNGQRGFFVGIKKIKEVKVEDDWGNFDFDG